MTATNIRSCNCLSQRSVTNPIHQAAITSTPGNTKLSSLQGLTAHVVYSGIECSVSYLQHCFLQPCKFTSLTHTLLHGPLAFLWKCRWDHMRPEP